MCTRKLPLPHAGSRKRESIRSVSSFTRSSIASTIHAGVKTSPWSATRCRDFIWPVLIVFLVFDSKVFVPFLVSLFYEPAQRRAGFDRKTAFQAEVHTIRLLQI